MFNHQGVHLQIQVKKKGNKTCWKRKGSFFTLPFILISIFILVACQPSQTEYACTDTLGCITVLPDQPIKIGVIQALNSGGGVTQSQAIQVAAEHKNNKLLGHPIELVIENSQCTPEGGTLAALKIIADLEIVGVLGTTCSGSAERSIPIISKNGLVMISGLNTAPSLTETQNTFGENWHQGYFRTIFNGAHMAHAAASFAYIELGHLQAATIDDGDVYSHELAREFQAKFTELGGEITFSGVINKGDTNMAPILDAVMTSGADVVYFPVFIEEASAIVLQAREFSELESMDLIGGETLSSNVYLERIGEEGVGMYLTKAFLPPNPIKIEASATYENMFGTLPAHHSFPSGYDAAKLLLDAIEATSIQADDGTIYVQKSALRLYLYNVKNINGASGTLTCTEFGDCGDSNVVIVQLRNPSLGISDLDNHIVYHYNLSDK